MPNGTKILSVTPSGASAWVHSVCIEAGLPDGAKKLYFLKVSFISTPCLYLRIEFLHVWFPIAVSHMKPRLVRLGIIANFHTL